MIDQVLINFSNFVICNCVCREQQDVNHFSLRQLVQKGTLSIIILYSPLSNPKTQTATWMVKSCLPVFHFISVVPRPVDERFNPMLSVFANIAPVIIISLDNFNGFFISGLSSFVNFVFFYF